MPGPAIEREVLRKSELALHSLTVITPDGSRRLCEVRAFLRRCCARVHAHSPLALGVHARRSAATSRECPSPGCCMAAAARARADLRLLQVVQPSAGERLLKSTLPWRRRSAWS